MRVTLWANARSIGACTRALRGVEARLTGGDVRVDARNWGSRMLCPEYTQ